MASQDLTNLKGVEILTYSVQQLGLQERDPWKQPALEFFGPTTKFGDGKFQFTFGPVDPKKELTSQAMALRIGPPIRRIPLKTYSEWQAFANKVRAKKRSEQEERW